MNAYHDLQSPDQNWTERFASSGYHFSQPLQNWEERPELASFPESLEPQMAQFRADRDAILNEVGRNYIGSEDASVRSFLVEHRGLIQLLLEAVPHLKTCFGTNVVVSLRVPIDEGGSRCLYAVAMWPARLRDVKNALGRFDHEWWLGRANQAAGDLTFTYELI